MPTITLSESCIAELRAALAASSSPPVVGQTPPVQPPAPPPTPPPVPPVLGAGFDNIIRDEWSWSHAGYSLRTADRGGVGPNGVVIIGFTVPSYAHGGGSISIAPWPGDISGATRTISISPFPGDFNGVFPSVRSGVDVGMQFWVGLGNIAPILYRQIDAGTRYYLNIATRDANGRNTALEGGRACDMIIQCSRPV